MENIIWEELKINRRILLYKHSYLVIDLHLFKKNKYYRDYAILFIKNHIQQNNNNNIRKKKINK